MTLREGGRKGNIQREGQLARSWTIFTCARNVAPTGCGNSQHKGQKMSNQSGSVQGTHRFNYWENFFDFFDRNGRSC